MIVANANGAPNGVVGFSYQVVGPYYTWYERPFIMPGGAGAFYVTVIVIFFAALSIYCCPGVSVMVCLCCSVICCCCFKSSKGGKRSKKATKSKRGGRQTKDLLTFSPPGGKGKGPPPKQLGVSPTGAGQSGKFNNSDIFGSSAGSPKGKNNNSARPLNNAAGKQNSLKDTSPGKSRGKR